MRTLPLVSLTALFGGGLVAAGDLPPGSAGDVGDSPPASARIVEASALSNFYLGPQLTINKIGAGIIMLNGVAAQDLTVTLKSTNQQVLSLPSGVTVPKGKTRKPFGVRPTAMGCTTVSASLDGVTKSHIAVVGSNDYNSAATLSLDRTWMMSGGSVTGTVTLSQAAPKRGVTVNLRSNSSSATVPQSVTVRGGDTSATFKVSVGGAGNACAIITAAVGVGRNRTESSRALMVVPYAG